MTDSNSFYEELVDFSKEHDLPMFSDCCRPSHGNALESGGIDFLLDSDDSMSPLQKSYTQISQNITETAGEINASSSPLESRSVLNLETCILQHNHDSSAERMLFHEYRNEPQAWISTTSSDAEIPHSLVGNLDCHCIPYSADLRPVTYSGSMSSSLENISFSLLAEDGESMSLDTHSQTPPPVLNESQENERSEFYPSCMSEASQDLKDVDLFDDLFSYLHHETQNVSDVNLAMNQLPDDVDSQTLQSAQATRVTPDILSGDPFFESFAREFEPICQSGNWDKKWNCAFETCQLSNHLCQYDISVDQTSSDVLVSNGNKDSSFHTFRDVNHDHPYLKHDTMISGKEQFCEKQTDCGKDSSSEIIPSDVSYAERDQSSLILSASHTHLRTVGTQVSFTNDVRDNFCSQGKDWNHAGNISTNNSKTEFSHHCNRSRKKAVSCPLQLYKYGTPSDQFCNSIKHPAKRSDKSSIVKAIKQIPADTERSTSNLQKSSAAGYRDMCDVVGNRGDTALAAKASTTSSMNFHHRKHSKRVQPVKPRNSRQSNLSSLPIATPVLMVVSKLMPTSTLSHQSVCLQRQSHPAETNSCLCTSGYQAECGAMPKAATITDSVQRDGLGEKVSTASEASYNSETHEKKSSTEERCAKYKKTSMVKVGKKGRFVSIPVKKMNQLMVRDLLSLSGNKEEISIKEKMEEYRRDLYMIVEHKQKRLNIAQQV